MPHGPCIVCGETEYPLSCGGPTICPACDCGTPPEVTKLRKKLNEATEKIIELMVENERLRSNAQGEHSPGVTAEGRP